MNKRIRELAIKAGAGEWGDSVVPAMMDIQKFALLIVAECAGIYDKIDNGNQHQGTDDYLLALRRTFRS